MTAITPYRIPGGPNAPFVAGENLTAYQYLLLQQGTTENQVVHVTAATQRPVALCLGQPAVVGETDEWGQIGIYEMYAGATPPTLGGEVVMDANGKAIAAAGAPAGSWVIGYCLQANAAAGDLVSINLNLTAAYQLTYTSRSGVGGAVNVTPGTVNAGTVSAVAITVAGVQVGDAVVIEPSASLAAGLASAGCKVTSANTVTVYIANITGSNITDSAAHAWNFRVIGLV